MGDAVIVSTARTPIGTSFKGTLVDVDALALGVHAVSAAVARSGLDPALIDDVILGESRYGGGDIARYAAIEAGIPGAPGLAHNRHCASGLAAVSTGRGVDQGGHGPGGRGRWRALPLDGTAVDPPHPGHRRLDRLGPAQPRGDARRAVRGHVDLGRLERRRAGRRHPRGDGRVGVPLPPAGGGGDRRRERSSTRSPRSRSPAATARRSCSTPTSIPAGTPASTSWRRSSRSTPRSKGSASRRATRRA